MMLTGHQVLHLASPQSPMMVESKFGIFTSITLDQSSPISINLRTVTKTPPQKPLSDSVLHPQCCSQVMIKVPLMFTDLKVWSMFKYLIKINKIDFLEPSRKMTSLKMISQRNQKMRLHEDRVLANS
jgi:hypothetical protein